MADSQLPPGFVLEQAQPTALPEGFVLEGQHADQPAESPGMLSQLGRQMGLAGRYAMEGAGQIAGLVSDPIGQFLPGYQRTGALASGLADKLGLPQPQGGLEEGVGAASRALVGSGLTMGAGTLAGAPALAAQPGLQLISAATGGAASDAARQGGAGEGGQMLAGLAAGLGVGAVQGLPGTIKSIVRGSGGQERVAKNLAAFDDAGATPSVGQATQNRGIQALETLLSRTPGSAGVIEKAASGQAEDIGKTLTRYADDLAPKANPVTAGRAIDQGITGPEGFVAQFKDKARELYDKVDQFIPSDTAVPLPATQSFLAKVSAPTKGAEATSALLSNPKLNAIGQALGSDLENSGGTLPYAATKALRTRVGEMIADAGLVSDVPRSQLKRLYGALSEDIRNQAKQSPEAYAATNRAENYYRAGMGRLEQVESVVGKNGGPEKIFQAAMSGTREGATTLRSVMQSLGDDESKIVTSAVVKRLGRANPSAQNDIGDKFSTETFLTNWNGMSADAKRTLFDRMGPGFRDNMDQIANVADNLRKGSSVFRNPSGTGQAVTQTATVGSAVTALLLGHPGGTAAIGGAMLGANGTARLLTSPTVVKWLASNSNRPIGHLPAQISVLANAAQKNDDPTAAEFAKQLGQ